MSHGLRSAVGPQPSADATALPSDGARRGLRRRVAHPVAWAWGLVAVATLGADLMQGHWARWANRPADRTAAIAAAPAPALDTADVAASPSRGVADAPPVEPQVEAMVARLADRLRAQPDDEAGWRRLVQAYETLSRFEEAVAGYRQLQRLRPQDPTVWSDGAVTLALARGETQLRGESAAWVAKALEVNPQHLQSLALAGGIAWDEGRPAEARRLWQRILDQLPPDSPLAASIQQRLSAAQGAR